MAPHSDDDLGANGNDVECEPPQPDVSGEKKGKFKVRRLKWEQRFAELEQWKEQHGHCIVPRFHTSGLGVWANHQRGQAALHKQNKPNSMTPDRLRKLQEIGFDLELKSKIDMQRRLKWEERFQELKQYRDEHGDCLVPRDFEGGLGRFANQQRAHISLFEQGKPTSMTAEKLKKLEEIGFEKELRGKSDNIWDARISELEEYREEHGDCLVPRAYEKSPMLAIWCKTQRNQYRLFQEGGRSKSKLTQARIDQLKSLDFEFKPNKEPITFQKRLRELQEYKDKNGDCIVAKRYATNQPLASWLERQRMLYKEYHDKGKKDAKIHSGLTEEKIKALQDLGFDFEGEVPEIDEFALRMKELKEYKQKHGHLLVHPRYDANRILSKFVKYVRAQYQKRKKGEASAITDMQLSELQEMGFEFDLGDQWEVRLKQLEKWKEEHGDCRVPRNHESGLGKWMNYQSAQYSHYRNGKPSSMTPSKIEKLKAVGWEMALRGSSKDLWEERISQLQDYIDEHGDAMVPRNYPKYPLLGVWVKTQRNQTRLFRNGEKSKLSQSRIDQLKSLGFEFQLKNSITFDLRLEQLKQYKATNGHLDMPICYPPNQPLATWLEKRRRECNVLLQKKGKKGPNPSGLTEEKIRKMQEIGFSFERKLGRKFDDCHEFDLQAEELRKYKAEHGNCLVPLRYEPNPSLGAFVHYVKLVGSLMSLDTIQELEKIGMVFDKKSWKSDASDECETAETVVPVKDKVRKSDKLLEDKPEDETPGKTSPPQSQGPKKKRKYTKKAAVPTLPDWPIRQLTVPRIEAPARSADNEQHDTSVAAQASPWDIQPREASLLHTCEPHEASRYAQCVQQPTVLAQSQAATIDFQPVPPAATAASALYDAASSRALVQSVQVAQHDYIPPVAAGENQSLVQPLPPSVTYDGSTQYYEGQRNAFL